MMVGAGSMGSAQAPPNLAGAPVDIHSGTCPNPVTEPAYDAGDLQQSTYGEIQDDEFLFNGLYEDQGAFGVDLNGDNSLSPDEIVGPAGEQTIPVWTAQADVGAGVDTTQQFVVAIHGSPEDYQTILACGSITDAVEAEGEHTIGLQPVGQSGLFGFSVLSNDNSTVRTYLFQRGQAPAPQQTAPPAAPVAGLPVDIHSGTCQNPTAEPAYDAGLAEPVRQTGETEAGDLVGDDVAGDGETGVGVPGTDVLGDDGILNQDDEGYLTGDVNGDGTNEVGIDQDGNGTLDQAEVVGIDANNDGALDQAELGGADQDAAAAAALLNETVYKADTAFGEDIQTNELFGQPHVVLVHKSEQEYATYLACGEIQPLVEENQIVVPLRPVGGSDFFGTALIQEDGSEAATFVFQGLQQDAQAAATVVPPPPTATPAPTATPLPPTNTPVPTAVIEETQVVTVTQVVTETEVVPAPTATALAQ